MTYDRLTLDQFAGPPRELPPLLTHTERAAYYRAAATDDASAEVLVIVWCDLGQRIPAKLKEDAK